MHMHILSLRFHGHIPLSQFTHWTSQSSTFSFRPWNGLERGEVEIMEPIAGAQEGIHSKGNTINISHDI